MELHVRNYWTAEEDEILKNEASLQWNTIGSVKNWRQIASKLPGRTNKDCRKRWSKVGVQVNKGHWKLDEDKRLREAVEEHGYCWTVVSQKVMTRHADQCAKRWYHFLDPALSREEWDKDEDDLLLEAVQTYGRSWKLLSEKVFPRRSATDIKNRYLIAQRRYKNEQDSRLGDKQSQDFRFQTPFYSHTFTSDEEPDQSQHENSPMYFTGNTTATVDRTSQSTEQNITPAASEISELPLLSNDYTKNQFPVMPSSTANFLVDMGSSYFSDQARTGILAKDFIPYNPPGMNTSAIKSSISPANSSLVPPTLYTFEEENLQDDLDIPDNSTHMSAGTDFNDTVSSSPNNYTVLLEDVRPEMMESLMNYVVSSQTQVKMKITNSETK